jgi:hypothetical protein
LLFDKFSCDVLVARNEIVFCNQCKIKESYYIVTCALDNRKIVIEYNSNGF